MMNFDVERMIVAQQIRVRLQELQRHILTGRRPIEHIEACVTGRDREVELPPEDGYKPFKLPQHWGGFDQTTWFRFQAVVPPEMKGACVVARIRPHGESLAFVDGKRTQGLDENRDMLFLTEKAEGNEVFEIHLESVPSVRFDLIHPFGYAEVAVFHQDRWDYYWDIQTLLEVLDVLPEDYAPRWRLLGLLDRSIKTLDLNAVGGKGFEASLEKARKTLQAGLPEFQHSYGMGKLILSGHSHIDTAWLWPIRETQRKCGRTFSTVLRMMERYPEYHFSCPQPAQYEWVKTYYPEIYKEIKKRVKEGRWEPLGCFWVEPDLNIPSGESLVRQAVYGNRFFREEFGVHSNVAWTPDTFGYCYALPQILRRAQVEFFVTTKIHWNSFTKFPYSFFHWEGTDGSRVLAVRPWDYNGNVRPENLVKQWNQYTQKDRTETFLFPFGFGDGGGGPTPEMIEMGKRLENVIGVPKCAFGNVMPALEAMRDEADLDELPVWNGELYFELHRGCQTTQARTKRNNRKCETLLRDTEILSSLAYVAAGHPYDATTIYDCWKQVLTNQFHDILPGSSINEVYRRTDAEYAEVMRKLEAVRDAACDALLTKYHTDGEGTPVAVFNTLFTARSDAVEVEMDLPDGPIAVVDSDGERLPAQRLGPNRLLFCTGSAPSMGVDVYWVASGQGCTFDAPPIKVTTRTMENACIRVRFDRNGQITSFYSHDLGREFIPEGARANVFQFFEDRPREWDAWEVDFNFEENMRTAGPPESIEVIENGPVRGVLRMVYRFGESTITQDVVMHIDWPRLDFVTHVDWRERRTMWKAAFPMDLRALQATYEVQFGAVERPTHRNRDADEAQFEVPAQRWADLSEGGLYGMSLLNDCKYGYDIRGNVMRITLLRSPIDPDPEADQGEHRFTYALYPHEGDWRMDTVTEAFALNTPMVTRLPEKREAPYGSHGSYVEVEGRLVIDTIKKAEDSDDMIVRVYEPHGQRVDAWLYPWGSAAKAWECDLMEENDKPLPIVDGEVRLDVRPFEIRTLKIRAPKGMAKTE